MPTLVTPRTRFMHMPKTGGTWVTGALAAGGVPTQRLLRSSPGALTAIHAALEQTSDYDDRFTFAFVRHPLDWWRSVWGHRMRVGWFKGHAIDSRVQSKDFNEFIALVIERLPGYLDERFCRYIGPPEAPISFVGRFETLVDDLILAMREGQECFDEASIRAHPPKNVNDYGRYPALYDRGLARSLAAAEHAIIERFYPDDPVPQRLLGTPRPVATRWSLMTSARPALTRIRLLLPPR